MPTAVTTVQTYWYVRVFIGSGNKWSAVPPATATTHPRRPAAPGRGPHADLRPGLQRRQLRHPVLPHSLGPPADRANIAYNIAAGLEHPLGIFPNAAADWQCTAPHRREDAGWPAEGTNCTDTQTRHGLNAAQDGFIDGLGGKKGLLDIQNARFRARPAAPRAAFLHSRLFGPSYTINNDTLSCFLTDAAAASGVNVGDVSAATYTETAPVLSQNIYKSARFIRVPVMGTQPANGNCCKYQIIGMRPGFITDQTSSAIKTTPATASNGVSGTNGNIASVQVVFINKAALPPPPDYGGALGDYDGSNRIMRMVN